MSYIGVYPIFKGVEIPKPATDHSACFDLRAWFGHGSREINGYSRLNKKIRKVALPPRNITDREKLEAYAIEIQPGDRILVPTGIIFDIPVGWSIRLHARSGLTLKKGLVLANGEGIVDSDYVEQTFVILHNLSSEPSIIHHGERIAQAEIMPVVTPEFWTMNEAPAEKTSRQGGFGSTGRV